MHGSECIPTQPIYLLFIHTSYLTAYRILAYVCCALLSKLRKKKKKEK